MVVGAGRVGDDVVVGAAQLEKNAASHATSARADFGLSDEIDDHRGAISDGFDARRANGGGASAAASSSAGCGGSDNDAFEFSGICSPGLARMEFSTHGGRIDGRIVGQARDDGAQRPTYRID